MGIKEEGRRSDGRTTSQSRVAERGRYCDAAVRELDQWRDGSIIQPLRSLTVEEKDEKKKKNWWTKSREDESDCINQIALEKSGHAVAAVDKSPGDWSGTPAYVRSMSVDRDNLTRRRILQVLGLKRRLQYIAR